MDKKQAETELFLAHAYRGRMGIWMGRECWESLTGSRLYTPAPGYMMTPAMLTMYPELVNPLHHILQNISLLDMQGLGYAKVMFLGVEACSVAFEEGRGWTISLIK